MRITFTKLNYKNFLSIGNSPMEYDLNSANITKIFGKNGSAKSSINDAIHYALFDRPFRKLPKKGGLVNSINKKKMMVELFFNDGKNDYKIERGMLPNIFKIYRDDELIEPPASLKDYQLYLEVNILKFNSKTFTQCVILGSTSYTPFMKLTVPDRRVVVEDILDLRIFSDMNLVAKARISANKSIMVKQDADINIAETELDVHIENNERIKASTTTRIEQLKAENDEYNDDIKSKMALVESNIEKQNELLSTTTELQNHKTKQRTLSGYYGTMASKMTTLSSQLKFYNDNDTCPTCKQEITPDVKHEHITTAKAKISKLDAGKKRLDDDVATIGAEVDALMLIINESDILGQTNTTIKYEISMLENNVKSNIREIQRLESETGTIVDVTVLKSKLKDLKSVKRVKFKDQQSLNDIASLLKDDGIKSKIIEKYLPTLNTLVGKYLDILDFNCQFTFDENFNEIIKSRGRDNFSYYSFSEGERLRIDLAILFAFREFATRKNTLNTNLMLMDEIGGGTLDEEGGDAFANIIKSQVGCNIFLIAPKEETYGNIADSVYNVQKHGNFSVSELVK